MANRANISNAANVPNQGLQNPHLFQLQTKQLQQQQPEQQTTQDTRSSIDASQTLAHNEAMRPRQPQSIVIAATEANNVRIPAWEILSSYVVIELLNPSTLKTSLSPFNLGTLVIDHDPSRNLMLKPDDAVTF